MDHRSKYGTSKVVAKYKKLMRLRAKRNRLDRVIARLEDSLKDKKSRWGSCSYQRNRRNRTHRTGPR